MSNIYNKCTIWSICYVVITHIRNQNKSYRIVVLVQATVNAKIKMILWNKVQSGLWPLRSSN